MLLLLQQILSPTMSLDTLKNINRTGYTVIHVKNKHRHNPNKIWCNRFESKYGVTIIVVISLKPKALLDQFPIEAGATRAIEIAVDVDELDREGILERNRYLEGGSEEDIVGTPDEGGDGVESGEGVKLAAGDNAVIGDCGAEVN
ncbi:hypothetical protein LR48_Vigan07g227500 [Vigna angularis]|uniref:Uncharacterized protein n=1 Tax=Phaseolus angularis TaxID=3914 RepID=A0A0L9V0V2_PHAAN|nr:hypothetical protein LR48_Vigan07g227500 [Vigna angularis]